MSAKTDAEDSQLRAMLERQLAKARRGEYVDPVLEAGILCALGGPSACQPSGSGWWGADKWRRHLLGLETE